MSSTNVVAVVVLLLVLARWGAEVWLEQLNRRHVLAHAGAVPEAFKGVMDDATYAKSVQYTLAKGRLNRIETTYDSAVLLLVLFSGVLPWAFGAFANWLGASAWAMAAFLVATGVALSLPGLPLGLVRAVPARRALRLQHHHAETLVDGPAQRAAAGLALGYPLLAAHPEAGRMDRAVVVAVGAGARCSGFNS